MTLTEALKSIYPAGRAPQPQGYAVGDEVEALWNGKWEPATVLRQHESERAYCVRWSNGTGSVLTPDRIRWPEPRPASLFGVDTALTLAKRDGKPPETFGYEIGEEVEVNWKGGWHAARVLPPLSTTRGVNVALVGGKHDGHKQVWHPIDVRRREGLDSPPSRCPRCSGPRDNLARAHLHLCGCLVKWDREAALTAVGEPEKVTKIRRCDGEDVWLVQSRGHGIGGGMGVDHPLRDTAIALWRERVSR